MQPTQALRMLSLSIIAAKTGITYTKGEGAFCPYCRERLRTVRTCKGKPVVRYCRCTTPGCPMYEMEVGIKTVQS